MKKIYSVAALLLLCWLPVLAQAQAGPDLVVVAPFNLPTNVVAGGIYPMSAVIKNQGNNGAQFNCIGYYLSADNVWDATDTYLGASCQSLLFPGQSGTCAISATIPALAPTGSRHLILVADPLNAEPELDETNNVVSFAVTVTAGGSALPDLELWRPSLSFSAVPAGGSTGAFTFIFNRGTGSVGAYEIGYYLSADTIFSAGSDVFLGQVAGGGLVQNNGTVHFMPTLTVPRTTAPGNYYLLLMADPRNLVAESNESNNSRALPLRVTGTTTATGRGAGDMTAVALYPNPLARGTRLVIQLAGGAAGQPAEVAFYDALGRPVARYVLPPTNLPTLLDTQGLPAGLYTVRITGPRGPATRRVLIE